MSTDASVTSILVAIKEAEREDNRIVVFSFAPEDNTNRCLGAICGDATSLPELIVTRVCSLLTTEGSFREKLIATSEAYLTVTDYRVDPTNKMCWWPNVILDK